jgi:CelD/BcsL family acetyltransferase involved in cellulose biosynthesis
MRLRISPYRLKPMTAHLDFLADGPSAAVGATKAGIALDRIQVSRDLGDFTVFWPRSDERGSARCHVFQCADVLKVWLDTIGVARGVDPHFVVVSDERGERGFALALGIERRYGVRVLTFLDGGVSDYNAPVVFANASAGCPWSLPHLIERLRGVLPPFDLVMFEKMPADVLDRVNPLVQTDMEKHVPSGHTTMLPGSWAEFAATRLPRRADARRKRRKLEAMGKLTFVVADDAPSRERLLEAMIRQKTQRYIETRGWDGFDRPGYRTYFRRMTERLGSSGTVHACALQLDDKVIAAHWGLVAGARFYSLMPSFDAEWSRFSPGRLLLEELIAWSYAHGITCFDFGIGDESYKFEFRDAVLPLFRAVIPVTLAGSACVFALNRKNDLRNSRAWQWLRSLRSRQPAAEAPGAAP